MEKHTFSDLSKAFGVNNLLTRCKKGDDWKTLAITHFQTMGVIVLYNGFNKQNICVDPEMVPYERVFPRVMIFVPTIVHIYQSVLMYILQMAAVCWWYFISKFSEFSDTVSSSF
uniref:Uncharacterized protein n=1 Tax=Cacopsylla melanoneura TaxID=428564 RepID=A0A8D8VNH4_9HEMI